MSNEIKCHVLVYGPPKAVVDFTDDFEREQFQAHVPIAADARPKRECDPSYLTRRLAEEHWGSRFIYPRPGVSIFRDTSARIDNELHRIRQEGYELYRPPTPNELVALIAFTVPSDPPLRWADQVISRFHDRGVMFIIRWWDMENYHRCVECGALDGICLRAGALWSVPGDDHTASWFGKTQCHCPTPRPPGVCLAGLPSGGLKETRPIGGGVLSDDAVVSMTAFADGPDVIRVISTARTGKRTMTRVVTLPEYVEEFVRDINDRNIVLSSVLGTD